MSLSLRFPCRAVVLLSLALPVGCAGSSQGSPATPGTSPMTISDASSATRSDSSAASRAIKLAVTNVSRGDIFILSTDGTLLSALRDVGAGDITSDMRGDVYAVETKHSFKRVREYTSDLKHTIATFDDSGNYPVGVDTFHNGEVIAVTNSSGVHGGLGNVAIFVKGVKVRTIKNPVLATAYFCAFDAVGNLYLDGIDSNRNSILGEIANAASGGSTYVPLTTSNKITAMGIQVTNAGNIAIQDMSEHSGSIYTYKPPVNGSFGSPIATTPIMSPTGFAGSLFAFTPDMSHLYAVDANENYVEDYAYPAGGNPISSIDVPFAGGIAVIPGQYPKSSP